MFVAEPEREHILLHPSLADRYRSEVARLSEALNHPSTKAEATTIIRSLLTEIRMIPEDGVRAIELVGEPKFDSSHRDLRVLRDTGGEISMG